MAKKTVQNIKENFPLYKQLVEERKSILESTIDITTIRKNHNTLLSKNTFLQHAVLADDVELTCEVKKDDHKCFSFKLRYENLCKMPFFHFDSYGSAHRNYDENAIPMKYQQVLTPHFNCYNEKGVSIAYKTAQLEDPNESLALQDLNYCMEHFCKESNVRYGAAAFPTINIATGEIPFEIKNVDPHQGLQFI